MPAPRQQQRSDLGAYFAVAARTRAEGVRTRSRTKQAAGEAASKSSEARLRRPRPDERSAIAEAAAAPRAPPSHVRDHREGSGDQPREPDSAAPPELLEPLGTPPPLSVREDPDTRKLYLRISPRHPRSPSTGHRCPAASSSPSSAHPKRRPPPRSLATEAETLDDGDSDQDIDLDATEFVPEHDTPTSTPTTARTPGSAGSASTRARAGAAFGFTPGAGAGTRVVPGSGKRQTSASISPPTQLCPGPGSGPMPARRPASPTPMPSAAIAHAVEQEQGADEPEPNLPLAYPRRRRADDDDDDDDEDDDVVTPRTVREEVAAARVPAQTPHRGARFSAPPPRKKARHEGRDPVQKAVYIPLPGTDLGDASSSANPFQEQSEPPAALQRQNAALPPPGHTFGPALPLPTHYAALLELHEAVETSLVSRLATASHSGSVERLEKPTGTVVRLHRAVHYSMLQHLVRQCPTRSSRPRALGKVQLSQLAWLWTDGAAPLDWQGHAPAPWGQEQVDELCGMGFVLERTKLPGGSYDWALGLEVPLASLYVSEALERATSPSPSTGRKPLPKPTDLMALTAQWQMGVEARRATVSARLKRRAMQQFEATHPYPHSQPRGHQDKASPAASSSFASSSSTAVGLSPASPSASRLDPPTPPPTWSVSKRAEKRPVMLPSIMGTDPVSNAPVLKAWPPGFDLATVPPVPRARLPTLIVDPPKALQGIPSAPLFARAHGGNGGGSPRSHAAAGDGSGASTLAPARPATAPTRANAAARGASLADRIRAKEAAAQARPTSPGRRETSVLSRLPAVAAALAALFAPASTGRFVPGTGTRKPARDVLSTAQNALGTYSPATPADAEAALDMLTRLAPRFLTKIDVPGAGQWYLRPAGANAWSSTQVMAFLREEARRATGRLLR